MDKGIVFISKYYCEICKKEREIHVYGDRFSRSDRDEQYEKEVIKWGRHFHWIDHHRICAICGSTVKSGELELLVNDGSTRIHKDYTDEYKKVKQGDKFGHLLIVHEICIHENQ